MSVTATINHKFISFSAVQIYDFQIFICIHHIYHLVPTVRVQLNTGANLETGNAHSYVSTTVCLFMVDWTVSICMFVFCICLLLRLRHSGYCSMSLMVQIATAYLSFSVSILLSSFYQTKTGLVISLLFYCCRLFGSSDCTQYSITKVRFVNSLRISIYSHKSFLQILFKMVSGKRQEIPQRKSNESMSC